MSILRAIACKPAIDPLHYHLYTRLCFAVSCLLTCYWLLDWLFICQQACDKLVHVLTGGVSNGISSPPILPGGFPLDYGSSQMGGFVTDTIPRAPVFPITTSKPRLGKRSIDSLLEAKISALGANEAFGEGPMSEGAVATPMQCPHCPYTASYESRINSHIRNVHSVEKAYKCTQCDFASAVAQSLSRHINAVHSDTQSNPDEKCKGVHVCALCGYRAAGKNILELHINGVHLKSKPHKCPHCSYTSAYPQYIPKHIAAVHEKRKPYSCDLCDYKSSSKQYLAKHCDAVHHNIKPHCCPHCPYSTSYSQYLSKHISAVHKDEKPYRCPYCDYRCAYKQYLPKHISFMHKDKTPLEETVKTEPMEETVPGMNQNGEQLSAVALTGTSPH